MRAEIVNFYRDGDTFMVESAKDGWAARYVIVNGEPRRLEMPQPEMKWETGPGDIMPCGQSLEFHCEVCGSNAHDTIAHDPDPVRVSPGLISDHAYMVRPGGLGPPKCGWRDANGVLCLGTREGHRL